MCSDPIGDIAVIVDFDLGDATAKHHVAGEGFGVEVGAKVFGHLIEHARVVDQLLGILDCCASELGSVPPRVLAAT